MEDTKEYLRTISESASEVAGTAANALGAKIPEANKVLTDLSKFCIFVCDPSE